MEAEQRGARRAGYGQALLKSLSAQLSSEYGSGFSVSALQYMRGFYLAYPDLLANRHALRVDFDPQTIDALAIQHAARVESGAHTDAHADGAWRAGTLHSGLSWTHYRLLVKVARPEVRNFYEIEAIRNGWSARQLERQIASLLFERLLKSRDRQGVLTLASEGQLLAHPKDAIKDPYVLEFLEPGARLAEVNDWAIKDGFSPTTIATNIDKANAEALKKRVIRRYKGQAYQYQYKTRPPL